MSGDVRAFTTDLLIAGGNGLPDLHVTGLDPINYVDAAFAARTTDATATTASATDTNTGGMIKTALGLPSVAEMQNIFKGGLVLVVMVVIGLLLFALGAWQLTKD